MVVMPFGKYRGQPIDQIPIDYLCWVSNNCDLRSPRVKAAIEERLKRHYDRRQAHQQAGSPPPPPVGVNPKDWLRRMSVEFHPDRRGGNTEGMRAVNRGYELLEEMARKVQ